MMNTLNRRHGRRAIVLLVAAAAIGGCAGHGEYTSAFKEEAELRLNSLKAATEWDRAHQQFLAGDLEKALRTIEGALAYQPEATKAHLLRGRILLEMGRLEGGIAALDRAVEIQPDNAEAHYYKGIVFERISKPEQALSSYLAADRLDPANPQYVVAAAEMLIVMDRLEEADALLHDHRVEFEHNPGIRQTLGHIAMMRDRIDEAIELFQEAHLLAPDDYSLVEDLARAQIAGGEFSEAEYNVRRILNDPETPNRRDLRHLQVRCLQELDRPVEARSILKELVRDEEGASDVTAWVELGNVACILDDLRQLRECGQRLAAMAPQRYEGFMFLAIWSRGKGDLASAVSHIERSIVRAPDIAGPRALHGVILFELERYDQALAAFESALEIDPNDASVQRLAHYVEQRKAGVSVGQ